MVSAIMIAEKQAIIVILNVNYYQRSRNLKIYKTKKAASRYAIYAQHVLRIRYYYQYACTFFMKIMTFLYFLCR